MAVGAQGRGVSEDATLDAFVDAEAADDQASGSDEQSRADAGSGQAESTDEHGVAPEDDAEPSVDDGDQSTDGAAVAVTSTWTDATACAACGESVPRLWQDGDERVCAGCKSWRSTGEEPCDR